ncbi:MAG: Ig-like domain-containing protein [Deltaproteobacteria bacterium]
MRWALATAFLFAASTASAQVGPGLGNLTYNASEVFTPVGFVESPEGHGNVAIVQGYLMVIYSSDGGGNANNGGIEFWDVSNPRSPSLAVRYDNTETHGLREAHGFSLAWVGTQLLLAAQGVDGVQIWDVTNPMAIQLLSYLDMNGISRGDYSGDWWLFWQAPYLYVAGVDSGLYVVDATDPLNPVVLSQTPTGDLGGVSPAQVFVVGNLAVIMETQGRSVATLDVSVPDAPRLLRQFDGRSGYSHLFAGDGKILVSGNIPPRATFLQVTPDGNISLLDSVGFFFDSGGYGSYQDGYFHSGFSNNYAKFQISPPMQIGTGSSDRTDRDEDFSTVLGNVVFVGDDHGVGTALIPHQAAPDTTAPAVEWMHPPSGSADVALTTRVGLSFSDHVDVASLSGTTLHLEDAMGNVVPAVVSAQMGLVNLAPVAPLEVATTYTIVAEGVRDLAQNASVRFEGTFTTGDGSVPFSPTAAVDNVDLNIGFGTYAIGTFDSGRVLYSDRNYVFEPGFPERFARQPYLITANVDSGNFLSNFLSFDLLAPAEVVILFDARASSTPNWMSGYTATGETVATTDTPRDAYSRRFGPGQVTVGGNGALGSNGADSMYSVVIIPDEVPCAIDRTPVVTGTVSLSAMGPANGTYEWRVAGQTFTDPSPSVFLPPGRHPIGLTVIDGPLGNTCSGVKIVHRPLVDVPARSASRLAWIGGDTINVNPDNGTVTRANAGGLGWSTRVGGRPATLAVEGDRVWVTDYEGSRLVVLDATSGDVARTIPLDVNAAPHGVVVAPDGAVFVALEATGAVVRLRADGTEEARATGIPTAHGLTWFDGRVYVTRFLSPDDRGEVHVLAADTLAPIDVVALPFDPGPDTEATGRGVPNYVADVQIAPDGVTGYVASKKDNIARGLVRDGESLTFETRVRTVVSPFAVATASAAVSSRYDVNDRDLVLATAVSPYADLLFVASQGVNEVDVFDVAKRERVSQFEVGRAPQGLALDAASGRLAVYNFLSRSVSYYDVAGLLDGTSNAVLPLGETVTVTQEALPANVLAGKRIFYDASDERMSRDSYISCASCHLDGGHDGRTWDFTQAGEGLRNTIALNGRAGLGHGDVHWTANFDEIQDFENDIRNAFGGRGFLTDEDFARTADPLGAPKAGLSQELDDLAAYVASLVDYPASPHRAADASLTLEARRGREVFIAEGCATCHAGATFTDGLRHDVGTIQPSSGQGIGEPLAGVGFDTPTLRGVFATAPYFHDGSAATLDDVLDQHGDVAARDDLRAYLLALDGTSLAPDVPCDSGPNECVETTMPERDGGVADAGSTTPVDDGGVTPDAGTEAPPADDGCGCNTTKGRRPGALVFLVLVALFARRRR